MMLEQAKLIAMVGKVLIIEDEKSIADTLVYALETDGFKPIWCSTASAGLKIFKEMKIDMILLDIGLPDQSGIDLCRDIRKHSDVPIFFLTARSEEIDRVLGLELGADDYITKPFSPREVTARVKVFFRRFLSADATKPKSIAKFIYGPFVVDAEKYQISYYGQILELRRYEYGILNLLVQNPGRVFSRQHIMHKIWDAPDMSLERTIDTHVKTIRSKLNQICQDDCLITHRSIGYSLKEHKL